MAQRSNMVPVLHGVAGQRYMIEGKVLGRGATWYKILASSRFQWNAAPHRWSSCPRGRNVFLGDTVFRFREPDAKDGSNPLSKYLRFRVKRRDKYECLWNHSSSCLGGGSFILNLERWEETWCTREITP
jgi:hypothetical protein